MDIIRFNDNNSNPNIYDYAFILTNEERKEYIPREEKSRREKIQKNMVYIKVYINGIFCFETPPMPLTYPNYEVEINNKYNEFIYKTN